MNELSSRDRLLTVYRRQIPDRVPISPWVYKMICMKFSKKRPFWKAQIETYDHFGIDGIIMLAPEARPRNAEIINKDIVFPETDKGIETIYRTQKGNLKEIFRTSKSSQTAWFVEKPVKNPEEDFPKLFEAVFLGPDEYDATEMNATIDEIGDKALVQAGGGMSFFSFINRRYACSLDQLILEFIDKQEFYEELQQKHLEDAETRVRFVCENTNAKALFCGCGSLNVLGPDMWRKWEKPFLKVFGHTAKEYGVFTHLHQHGVCKPILEDIIECGIDVVCPFEPPKGGDIDDLGKIKQKYGDRLIIRGNLHTIEVIQNGSPELIHQSVKEAIEKAADGGGFVLSSGEEVSGLTPYENIEAFVAAGKEFGGHYT